MAWTAIKIDMKKAYDRVEWDFILKCLQELGFHPIWNSWIQECISSVSYSIIVNDEPNGLFTPTAIKIPCLLFADDCFLFCKANSESCNKLKSILDLFCSYSGQLVNFHKSVLTFLRNATNTQKQLVTTIFNIPHRESLGKYLGCPVFQGRPSVATFQQIINKATTQLERWKANCLSKAGRSVLIQSHLESLPAHTTQCFELPKNTTKYLDKCNREFFWKKTNSEKGLSLIA